MRPHPAIAALRSDDAPQRRAQTHLYAAVEAWRSSPATRAVLGALARYGEGADLSECPPLGEMFVAGDRARNFAAGFATNIASAVAQAPLGHVPLRHFTGGAVSTLMLARAGRAALFLTGVDGAALAAQPAPVSVSFAATEAREAVLAGSARADLVTWSVEGLTAESLDLVPPLTLARDGARQALVLRDVQGVLVSLRLQRRATVAQATREVDLASGRVIHQAAASAEESRTELMMALLGRMNRLDAAPTLAAIASAAGSDGLRWQALRECLGLDTASGFAVLSRLSEANADPLSGPAKALRDQLIAAHPQLAELEPCPA